MTMKTRFLSLRIFCVSPMRGAAVVCAGTELFWHLNEGERPWSNNASIKAHRPRDNRSRRNVSYSEWRAMRVVGAEKEQNNECFWASERGEAETQGWCWLLDKNKWMEWNRSDIHTFITANRTPLIHIWKYTSRALKGLREPRDTTDWLYTLSHISREVCFMPADTHPNALYALMFGDGETTPCSQQDGEWRVGLGRIRCKSGLNRALLQMIHLAQR
jgi:hypothetical protein